VLKVGAHADITIFDEATVIDRADFDQSTRPAAGIEIVIVNGVPVWLEGRPTGERPGRLLTPKGDR
jgi:N-acyl-D-amino-acid deacylase